MEIGIGYEPGNKKEAENALNYWELKKKSWKVRAERDCQIQRSPPFPPGMPCAILTYKLMKAKRLQCRPEASRGGTKMVWQPGILYTIKCINSSKLMHENKLMYSDIGSNVNAIKCINLFRKTGNDYIIKAM